MNRKLISLSILFLIVYISIQSCQNQAKNESQNATVKIESLYTRLSKFYKDTTFNGIYIYPDTTYVDSIFVFKGTPIDSSVLALLPYFAAKDLSWDDAFFGVYKFEIDSVYSGFITRVPGEYTSSDFSLWIFNRPKDELVASMDIAALFGDAGDCLISNSYLFLDQLKQIHVLNRLYTSYDHSVEDSADTRLDEQQTFLHTKWTDKGIDTLSNDSLALRKTYPVQMGNLIW